MELCNSRIILYSAEAGKCAAWDMRMPNLSPGACIDWKGSVLRIDCPVYVLGEKMLVYACGIIGRRMGGEDDGASIYFKYGQLPFEIFERFVLSHKMAVEVHDEKEMPSFLRYPVMMEVVEQFENDDFVIPPSGP